MQNLSRRRFLQGASSIAASSALGFWRPSFAKSNLAKFVQALPIPGDGIVVISAFSSGQIDFTLRQVSRILHPALPPTPVWAYDNGSSAAAQAGSLGPVIVTRVGAALTVHYTHALPATYPDWLPVDPRLVPLSNQVRILTHLHGGAVTAASDGSPASNRNGFGPGETQTAHYPNAAGQTNACMQWFHDHALGATRLNVLAGLAGAYLLRDDYDTGQESNRAGLPAGEYEIPLVIQDRMFSDDGSFLYPTSDIPGVTWIGEYFGDVMLVNGRVWPFLEVEPRLYRLRFLNGCNARILNLQLGGARLHLVGGDEGLLSAPLEIKRLVLAPGERADVVADFRAAAGSHLVLQNLPLTKPYASPAPPLPHVMQVRVGSRVTRSGPLTVPSTLRSAALPQGAPSQTRFITLNEVNVNQPDWFLNLNGARFEEPVTETPAAGATEDWLFINLTGDTHPMHMHLVNFRVMGHTRFDVDAYVAAFGGSLGVPGGVDPRPYAQGAEEPPQPEESGAKDTVKVNPGTYTRVRARFDLPPGASGAQDYVYHCHILEHEDNDMMRPFRVV